VVYADDHLHGLQTNSVRQVVDTLNVYTQFAEISGLKISLEKTSIMGVNTNPAFLEEVSEVTGIRVVNGFRYLGLEIRPTYGCSKKATFGVVDEGIKDKYNRINTSHVDLFHRKQLIQTVIVPSYNHAFMTFGFCPEVGKKLDQVIIDLLWTKKVNGQVKQGRTLVARGRIGASYVMGGLEVNFTEEIVTGLMLNILKKLIAEAQLTPSKQTFMFNLFNSVLEGIHAPNWEELLGLGGQAIWYRLGVRLGGGHPFSRSFLELWLNYMSSMTRTGNHGVQPPLQDIPLRARFSSLQPLKASC
jgi:hypothetical protein